MRAKYLEIPVNTIVSSGTSELVIGTTASAGIASGTATSDTTNKLVDSGATFVADGVVVGDIAYNVTDGSQAAITAVANTELSFASDLFPDGNENYAIRKEKQLNATAGTQTTVAALINETSLTLTADIFDSPTLFNDNFTIEPPATEVYDFGKAFTSTVTAGDILENTTANTSETVTQVIDDFRLKLSGSFGTIGNAYNVFDTTIASSYLIDMDSIVFVDRVNNEQTKIILNTNVTPTLTIDHSDQGTGRIVAIAIQDAMKRGYVGVNMPDPPGPSTARVQMPLFESAVITVESVALS